MLLKNFLHCTTLIFATGVSLRAEDGFLRLSSSVDPSQQIPDGFTSSTDDLEDGEVWAQALTLNTQSPDPPTQNNTEVIAQVGGEATFSCVTHHLSDEMVTWLKRDDDQLLTVGQQVYAAEPRFTASHSHQSKAWELWVKDVQLSDAGQYECQLTTHPPVTFFFTLKVTQAEAVVSGPNVVHIEEGSKLALECHVRFAAAPPVYIFWYHNSTMVNYANQRALEVQHGNYSSSLVVTRVRPSDAGTYTCEPHLATPANISVHVVTGKKPAAMQHGRTGDTNLAFRPRASAPTTILLPTASILFTGFAVVKDALFK